MYHHLPTPSSSTPQNIPLQGDPNFVKVRAVGGTNFIFGTFLLIKKSPEIKFIIKFALKYPGEGTPKKQVRKNEKCTMRRVINFENFEFLVFGQNRIL